VNQTRKTISEITASIAIILLAIYLVDVLTTIVTGQPGFLPLSSKDRGMIFGGASISLFIISYIVAIRIPSRLMSILLIIGGAVIGTAVLVSTFITPQLLNSYDGVKVVTPPLPQFVAIVVIGYVIMCLGIFKIKIGI
jgi:hypothetical protein